MMQSPDPFFRLPVEGWAKDYVQGVTRQLGEAGPDVGELQIRYLKVMQSPDGQAVIQDLIRRFKRPATFDASLGFENGAALGFQRQGQQDVVDWIIGMAEAARNQGERSDRPD